MTFWLIWFHNDTCSYCGWQVAASVSADPAQAADNVEHLELELHNRRGGKNIVGCYKWLPFTMKMRTVENRQQWAPLRIRKMEGFHPSSSHWEQLKLNCASTHKRFWIFILWKVVRCSSKRVFPEPSQFLTSFSSFFYFYFAYCCRLPLSASRLDQLAKHFIAIQSDVVGLLDGLLCHLLAVHVQLDFLWRDADVELQEGERMERGHY